MRYALALAAAMAATGASAQSALDGYYVGAFVGSSSYEGSTALDGERIGLTVGRSGVFGRFYNGVEFGAAVSSAEATVGAQTLEEDYEIAATLRFGYAFNERGAIYGKLSARRVGFSLEGAGVSDSDSYSGLGIGIGGEYALGNGFGLALEYDEYEYDIDGVGDLEGSMVSLSIRRGF